MHEPRQSPNLDDRIRQYSEELMRTYRRQASSAGRPEAAAPPRDIPAPMPRADDERKRSAAPLPEEPVRGEIPPAVPPAQAMPHPLPDWDEGSCRPHYPVDSAPSMPPSSGQDCPAKDEQAHPGPGITLYPDISGIPREADAGAAASPESAAAETSGDMPEYGYIPPAVVYPPEEDAIYAFPGEAEAREVSSPAGSPAPRDAEPPADAREPAATAPAQQRENGEDEIPGEENPLSNVIPPAPPETGIARLRVWVTTARQAVPIEGARVVVSKETVGGEIELIKVLTTNQDGTTATIDLPAVPAEYSQKPGYDHPYTSYTIEISKPGYFSVRNTHVPLYGGVSAVQPADLTPLPEEAGLDTRPDEIIFEESGPENL